MKVSEAGQASEIILSEAGASAILSGAGRDNVPSAGCASWLVRDKIAEPKTWILTDFGWAVCEVLERAVERGLDLDKPVTIELDADGQPTLAVTAYKFFSSGLTYEQVRDTLTVDSDRAYQNGEYTFVGTSTVLREMRRLKFGMWSEHRAEMAGQVAA